MKKLIAIIFCFLLLGNNLVAMDKQNPFDLIPKEITSLIFNGMSEKDVFFNFGLTSKSNHILTENYIKIGGQEKERGLQIYYSPRTKDSALYLIKKNKSHPLDVKCSGISINDLNDLLTQGKNIRSLDINSNGIGDAGVQAIAESKNLTKLTKLNISWNNIVDTGVQAIANSKYLTNLTNLNIRGNHIGPDGAKAIAASQNLTNLTYLNIGYNYIGDAGVQAIAESEYLINLTYLDISDNNIGTDGAKAIAKSQNLTNLTYLNISYNNIGPDGAEAIANSKYLQNLTKSLSENSSHLSLISKL